jgi:hypothetical protein
MNKKQQQVIDIQRHGENLKVMFNLDKEIDPYTLCVRVHRIEVKAHRFAERLCNEPDVPEEEQDRESEKILKSLDKILNFRAQGVPVFINYDPRGYALKIKDKYVREHGLTIYQDWGGYGIIAPEF